MTAKLNAYLNERMEKIEEIKKPIMPILIEAAEEIQRALPKGRFLPIPCDGMYNSFLGSGGVGIMLFMSVKYAPGAKSGTTYDIIKRYIEYVHFPNVKKYEKGIELEFLSYLKDTAFFKSLTLVQIAKTCKLDLWWLEKILEDKRKEVLMQKIPPTQKFLDDFL